MGGLHLSELNFSWTPQVGSSMVRSGAEQELYKHVTLFHCLSDSEPPCDVMSDDLWWDVMTFQLKYLELVQILRTWYSLYEVVVVVFLNCSFYSARINQWQRQYQSNCVYLFISHWNCCHTFQPTAKCANCYNAAWILEHKFKKQLKQNLDTEIEASEWA